MRINIIYSRSVLKLSVSQISKEIGIKYNSIMNILKCARLAKENESGTESSKEMIKPKSQKIKKKQKKGGLESMKTFKPLKIFIGKQDILNKDTQQIETID